MVVKILRVGDVETPLVIYNIIAIYSKCDKMCHMTCSVRKEVNNMFTSQRTITMSVAVVYGNQLVEPGCNLPRNFTGTWFTAGEFDTNVVINATHIYYKTKLDQFTYRETYFTCQQNRDSRFLMTAVTVGKW